MKRRLDDILIERGWADEKAQAQALIMSGRVSGSGRLLDKPGFILATDVELHVKTSSPYVSRAGEKLASVAGRLGLHFAGAVVLDVGSSTGGFTDFVLRDGALRVYAVDVGKGQLAYVLRQDRRVVVMEKTDIREAVLPEAPDMAVIDVSFISLKKVLEATAKLLKRHAYIVAMAKPQFEATRAVADQWQGVIPLGEQRDDILEGLRQWVRERFEIHGESDSGLAGAQGNVEHFFLLKS